MSHYFSRESKPDVRKRSFAFRLAGDEYAWVSAEGVFCRERLDAGSRLLLETLDLVPGEAILDLGCGHGVLGLVLAHRNPQVTSVLIDVNPQALDAARVNRERLGLGERTHLVRGSFVTPFRRGAFDRIVSNPPVRVGKRPLIEAFQGCLRALRPGGRLDVVIRVKQGGRGFHRFLGECFPGGARILSRKKGYLVIEAVGDTGALQSPGRTEPKDPAV